MELLTEMFDASSGVARGGHHAPGAIYKGSPNVPNKKLLDKFYFILLYFYFILSYFYILFTDVLFNNNILISLIKNIFYLDHGNARKKSK